MNGTHRSIRWATLAMVWLSAASDSSACGLCWSLPIRTIADHVIENDGVVLVREYPGKPFVCQTIETLKGPLPQQSVDVFLDSASRRRLAAQPNSALLVVRADEAAPWRSLGVANAELLQVVRAILHTFPEWSTGQEQRHQFFGSLLGHPQQDIFQLAYVEVARAPYRTIRKLARGVPRDALRCVLQQRAYFRSRSLAILMLGLSDAAEDQRVVVQAFQRCRDFSLTHDLASWTAAFIELHGHAALQTIEIDYLLNPRRSEDEVRSVLAALSLHGQGGRTDLRDRIAGLAGSALAVHPWSAGILARDLRNWNWWQYRGMVAEIRAEHFHRWNEEESASVAAYLAPVAASHFELHSSLPFTSLRHLDRRSPSRSLVTWRATRELIAAENHPANEKDGPH